MAKYPQIGIRVDEDFLEQLDAWRRKQDDFPSRTEAVRRLVEIGLAESGYVMNFKKRLWTSDDDAALAREITTGKSLNEIAEKIGRTPLAGTR
jgi:hypothetical protein